MTDKQGDRSRSLIYVFPALMDVSAGVIGFASLVQAAKLGASTSMVGALGAVISAAYLTTCLIVGRLLDSRNSAAFVAAGCGGIVVVSGVLAFASSVAQLFPLMAFAGISLAFFFVSFQVFMKAVDTGGRKSVSYSAGTYTFAWSVGYAIGPLVAGLLMQWSEADAASEAGRPCIACYVVSGALALITVAGTVLLRHHAEGGEELRAGEDGAAAGKETAYSRMPDLAWVGWVASGMGVMQFGLIMRIFPKEATDLGWRDVEKGMVLFLMCMTLALTGFALRRSRSWMYDWRRICAFGVFGMAGIAVMGVGSTPLVYYSGAVCFGVYAGAFFFYLVFHSLSHPSRSARYVSMNEAVVGVAGIVGPIWGGVVADLLGFRAVYLAGAVLIAAALVFQTLAHRRYVGAIPA